MNPPQALKTAVSCLPIFLAFQVAASRERERVVHSFALNPYVRVLDGQWEGATVASDGNCYFASSTHAHNHGAAFFRYDPRAKTLTLLCEDITRVCGEDPTRTPPQGKIHSDIVEVNGSLYFATHLANYWPAAEAAYTGAHVIGYELASGRFRDYGIVRPNYSVYSGLAVDRRHNRLYVYVTPFSKAEKESGGSHLYRIDLTSGVKEDLGLLKRGGHASSYLFVDRRGDCWFALETGRNDLDSGTLFCARAATGEVKRWPDALPPRYSMVSDTIAPEQQNRRWRWVQPLPDGDRCVFTMVDDGRLWTFDSRKIGTPEAFQPVKHIGSTYLGLTLGKDQVFYIQRANRQPGPTGEDLHLLSITLDPARGNPIVDHGLIVDQDGRRPWRVPSLATNGQGFVFLVGDWRLLPGDKSTLRHNLHDGEHQYDEVPSGQFFAVADVRGSRQ
jgi:hypothetical protein